MGRNNYSRGGYQVRSSGALGGASEDVRMIVCQSTLAARSLRRRVAATAAVAAAAAAEVSEHEGFGGGVGNLICEEGQVIQQLNLILAYSCAGGYQQGGYQQGGYQQQGRGGGGYQGGGYQGGGGGGGYQQNRGGYQQQGRGGGGYQGGGGSGGGRGGGRQVWLHAFGRLLAAHAAEAAEPGCCLRQ